MNTLWQQRWPAPAKINLFLHVVGRRADGLHELQTVFRFIERSDYLSFKPRDDGRILNTRPLPGVADAADLCLRAARALQRASGCRQGVEISLEKQLPMGGGLGGGSSDAATVLLVLNRLWQTGLSSSELQQLGLTLGADVPIFIHGQAAFAGGVGEQFSPVSLPAAWYLVLVPPVQVPTAQIFQANDLCHNTPRIAPADWRPGWGHNDLEAVACRLYPPVADHLAWLHGYAPARMSGSGACVFAEFSDEAAARAAQAALPARMQGFLARGLERNPVLDCLAGA